jgi:hypothetical protein
MGNAVVGTNTDTTRDHFWNVGANEDGRHRFINSPSFTVGGNPADPVVGVGMNAVLFLKTTNNQPQWFTRTDIASGSIQYQATPNFLSGTKVISPIDQDYTNIVTVPNNTYGEIFMWRNSSVSVAGQSGFFRAIGNICQAWGLLYRIQGSSDSKAALKFGNGTEASGLNIRARNDDSIPNQTWNYRIIYRAM